MDLIQKIGNSFCLIAMVGLFLRLILSNDSSKVPTAVSVTVVVMIIGGFGGLVVTALCALWL